MQEKRGTEKPFYPSILIGQITGVILLVVGMVLVVLGVTGAIEIKVSLGSIKGWLKNASPGLVLTLIGVALLAYYKPKFRHYSFQSTERQIGDSVRTGVTEVLQVALEQIRDEESLPDAHKRTKEEINNILAEAIQNYLKVRHLYEEAKKDTWKTIRKEITELESRFPQLDSEYLMDKLNEEQTGDDDVTNIERNGPSQRELESKLPIRETLGGTFSPFSSVLVITSTSVPAPKHLRQLSTAGAPLSILHQGTPKLDWDQIGSNSVVRHEIVHFIQSMLSPIIMDYSFQKRIVLATFLDCLRNRCSSNGIIRFPVELELTPDFTAMNSLYQPEPLGQFNTTHILEALAIYHQFMRAEASSSNWFIREAVYAFNKQGIKNGLYSKLYKSFVFDFRDDAFNLFPFVAWTSLLPLKDTATGKRSTPAVYFLSVNEMLFSSAAIRKNIIDRLETEADVAEVWRMWLDILEQKLGIVLEPLDMTINRFVDEVQRVVRQIKRFTKPEYFLPQIVHLRHMACFGYEVMPSLIKLFMDDSYASVFERVGWPTFLFDSGPFCVCGPTAEDSHLISWQLNWHLMEKFLDRIAGRPVANLCPKASCPLHALSLCTGHRPYPNDYKDCTFPLRVREVMGLNVDLCHFDKSSSHGKLTVDLNSFEHVFSR